MKKTIILITFLLAGIAFPQQLSKAYILSEGGFSTGTSKLSLYNNADGVFNQSIFTPGQLGLYPDGILLYENYLYVMEQGSYGGSGKIYKLDTNGTVINSASVGTNPYSMAIANGKIYITNGTTSKVSVIKLSDFSLVKELSVGVFPQEIISTGNKVFVANTSLYGGASDSTISVIDVSLDSVVAKITVHKDPSSFAISNDGFLLAGCPGDASYSRIYKINTSTNAIVKTYSIPNYGFGKDISVDKNSSNLYFIANSNDIVKYNTSDSSAQIIAASVYPANYYYGYAFDYVSRKHYILDAKSFTVNGSLVISDTLGNTVQTFTTCIGPRRVMFKYNSSSSGIENNLQTIAQFELAQNYPNPFNPSTLIKYNLPKESFVNLRVYNSIGQLVKTLISGKQNSGSHEVEFNAANLSSGVYFYTLETESFKAVKKMVLMK
jgi:YVTN family beta-propeller protein